MSAAGIACRGVAVVCFGHNEPRHPLPYGMLAEIDCQAKRFAILEAAVE